MHSFELSHDMDGAIVLKIISSFKDVAYRELAAGVIIKDEFYIGEELAADDINNVFSGYVAELYKILIKTFSERLKKCYRFCGITIK